MTQNPFTFGNPVRDPQRFFGRKEEIRQVTNRLLSSAHESTSIVGERRMGKTSLLKYLSHPEVAPSLGLVPDRYCLIYLDFQGLTDITPQRFWQRVLSRMSRATCSKILQAEIKVLQEMESFDLFDLEDLCEAIASEGLTTVLLLDEFEYVTQNTNFGPDFFGGLRALAIHHNLPLVTATQRELVDLCHSAELKGSPFFNIFANVVLRPFSHTDALEMVRSYLAEAEQEVTTLELDWVLNLGGGHPFFIQMAGYYLVEAKAKALTLKDIEHEVTTQFDRQADAHFSYLWSHCTDSEKITLLAAISLGKQKPSRKTLPCLENLAHIHGRASLDVPELVKRGLLIEVNQAPTFYRVLSNSLERWISREMMAVPEDKESPASVEMWLKTGGKDVVDPVKGALPKFKKKYWPLISTVLQELSLDMAGSVAFELLIKALL
jgi:hypothetical protein